MLCWGFASTQIGPPLKNLAILPLHPQLRQTLRKLTSYRHQSLCYFTKKHGLLYHEDYILSECGNDEIHVAKYPYEHVVVCWWSLGRNLILSHHSSLQLISTCSWLLTTSTRRYAEENYWPPRRRTNPQEYELDESIGCIYQTPNILKYVADQLVRSE